LNREALSISHADDDRLVVDLPDTMQSGALEVTLPDGDTVAYHLEVEPQDNSSRLDVQADRWAPSRERT
jgi:hypothetical protein